MNTKTIILFMLASFVIPLLSAQNPVSSGDKAKTDGIYNAFTIDLPDTDKRMANEVWKNYMKSYRGRVKKVKKGQEFVTEGVKIAGVGGADLVNLYALATEVGDATEFTVWFDVGGEYNLGGDAYGEAEKFMLMFGLEVTKEKIRDELRDAEKMLKSMEGDLKKLHKNKDQYEREIVKAQDRIKEMEKNIEQNLADQEAQVNKIDGQRLVVKEIEQRLQSIDN